MSGTSAVARGLGIGSGLLLAALLSACGGSAGSAGSGDSGSTLGNLLAFNSLTAPPMPPPPKVDADLQCPQVEVLDGTSSSRVYAGSDQSNSGVKYQFSLGDVARECSRVGDRLVLKVGVEGRALVGPAGSPGTFSAPIRIAIRRDKDEKAVETKLYPVPVTIPAGEGQAPFSLVADPIEVPFTTARANEDYTIVVGFDAKGAGTAAGPARKRRKP